MAENEEDVGSVDQKSGGSGKGLMVALIALVVILLLLVIGGGYFLYSNGAFNGGNGQTQAVEEKSENKGEFFKVAINDLVLNITNSKGREKLMKLSFSIKSIDENIETLIEENKAEVIDVVISQISARSSEELLTVGGKELLKEELIEQINKILNAAIGTSEDFKKDNVKQLFFTSFVIK